MKKMILTIACLSVMGFGVNSWGADSADVDAAAEREESDASQERVARLTRLEEIGVLRCRLAGAIDAIFETTSEFGGAKQRGTISGLRPGRVEWLMLLRHKVVSEIQNLTGTLANDIYEVGKIDSELSGAK